MEQTLDPYLIVTLGAVILAVLASFFAVRAIRLSGRSGKKWKMKAADLDRQLGEQDSIFGAYPGLILVWDGTEKGDSDAGNTPWGNPKVYGSTAALASVLRFSETETAIDLPNRVLNSLADHKTISAQDEKLTLRDFLSALREKGETFSISIVLPEGNIIEAAGRVAGRQVVLWLEDASIRGEDEKSAISRFETSRLTTEDDPTAFIEMMARAPFPVWRLSNEGKIVWANTDYIEAVSASDLRDVLNNQIHLDDDTLAHVQGVLSKNEKHESTRHIVLNGERRSTTLSLFPVSGGVAGIALDASKADGLKDALIQHVEAHDKLLNAMDEAIITFGANKVVTFRNKAFEEMFGIEPSWFNDDPSHSDLLDHLREKREVPEQSDFKKWKQTELSLYTDWPDEMPDELWGLPDGRTLRLVKMRDPQGGISMLLSDMTDSILLKSQLGTLINVQRATLPHFKDIVELSRPLFHKEKFWEDITGRITDPNPDVRRHVEGEIRRSDEKMMTWLSKPLPDGATLVAWEDVTSSRLAEAALIERAEALEDADRMKTEFVGHVSYQLRTPLTTITGYADFLQNSGAGEMTDKQSEYVFAIQTASADLAVKADDTRIGISVNCDEDIGIIRGDETRLKQVVHNLLSNAIRFTKPGGKVEIGGKKAAGGGVMIWVKDNGVGIPTDRQPQVFQSFEGTRGGAGLGLALVQRFVDCHGGWVELESEEGKGTHVTCFLPKEAPILNAHPELFQDA